MPLHNIDITPDVDLALCRIHGIMNDNEFVWIWPAYVDGVTVEFPP